jgi:hypothetical protein
MAFDAERFAEGLHEHILKMLQPYREKIRELEQQVRELEQGSLADAYRGTFAQDTNYGRGDMVTDKGAVWLCLHSTTDRPGPSPNWRMIAKGVSDEQR